MKLCNFITDTTLNTNWSEEYLLVCTSSSLHLTPLPLSALLNQGCASESFGGFLSKYSHPGLTSRASVSVVEACTQKPTRYHAYMALYSMFTSILAHGHLPHDFQGALTKHSDISYQNVKLRRVNLWTFP